jgi:hypothetical protein
VTLVCRYSSFFDALKSVTAIRHFSGNPFEFAWPQQTSRNSSNNYKNMFPAVYLSIPARNLQPRHRGIGLLQADRIMAGT